MNLFKESLDLIGYEKNMLSEIEKEYENVLNTKNITIKFEVMVKNFVSNLCSALDYCAFQIVKDNGKLTDENRHKIYFPYVDFKDNNYIKPFIGINGINGIVGFDGEGDLAKRKYTEDKFIESFKMKMPGIFNIDNNKIFDIIKNHQYYNNIESNWLPIIMKLNNINKHQKLFTHVTKEFEGLEIESGGLKLRLEGDSSIQVGGKFILNGVDMKIERNVPFSRSNPPQLQDQANVNIDWTDIVLITDNEPVIPFLYNSIRGVEEIINELSEYIKPIKE